MQSAVAVIQSEYDKFKAGEKTEEEAQEDAKDVVRAMRYREIPERIFWIDGMDYVLVAHAVLTDQEGDNRKADLMGQNGVMITQSVVNVCNSADKCGYNEFYFTKSDGVTVAPKIAYSELFEPWGWAVCTGNYVDEINAAKEVVKAELDKEYLNVLIRSNAVCFSAIFISLAVAFFSRQADRESVKEDSGVCTEAVRGRFDHKCRCQDEERSWTDGRCAAGGTGKYARTVAGNHGNLEQRWQCAGKF